MNDTEILLNKLTSKEEKNQSANNIIDTYNLPLDVEQILFAHYRIRSFFNDIVSPNKEEFIFNHTILLNMILNINTNLYTAIIIALYNKLLQYKLMNLMIIEKGIGKCINIGSKYGRSIYIELLDYYEFDISNIPNISDEQKNLIEDYRQQKYSGKLTKSAIK